MSNQKSVVDQVREEIRLLQSDLISSFTSDRKTILGKIKAYEHSIALIESHILDQPPVQTEVGEDECSNPFCYNGYIDMGYNEKMRCSYCEERDDAEEERLSTQPPATDSDRMYRMVVGQAMLDGATDRTAEGAKDIRVPQSDKAKEVLAGIIGTTPDKLNDGDNCPVFTSLLAMVVYNTICSKQEVEKAVRGLIPALTIERLEWLDNELNHINDTGRTMLEDFEITKLANTAHYAHQEVLKALSPPPNKSLNP